MPTDVLFTIPSTNPAALLAKFKAAVTNGKTWKEAPASHPNHFLHTDPNYKGGVLKAEVVSGALTIEAYFVQGSDFGKATLNAGALLYFLTYNLQPDAAKIHVQVR